MRAEKKDRRGHGEVVAPFGLPFPGRTDLRFARSILGDDLIVGFAVITRRGRAREQARARCCQCADFACLGIRCFVIGERTDLHESLLQLMMLEQALRTPFPSSHVLF
jgi:hypothetical protein